MGAEKGEAPAVIWGRWFTVYRQAVLSLVLSLYIFCFSFLAEGFNPGSWLLPVGFRNLRHLLEP